jgi:hypothetical protein
MQAVWILLAKTRYKAVFWQSSKEQGVQQTDIPFDMSAEYLPSVAQLDSGALSQLADAGVPANAAFDHIITQTGR